MIICPWCGTGYPSFQSNCTNCGGPLYVIGDDDASSTSGEEMAAPPPAPRPISGKYVRRLLRSDGWGVVAFVFGLLGVIFSVVGAGLTLAVVAAATGIPLLVIGLIFLVVALGIGTWRYDHARRVVDVLRTGEATQGHVIEVRKDYAVRVNRQHPWVVRYHFQVNGQSYEGDVRTLNPVGARLQPGKTVWILYSARSPEWNCLYPHP